MTKAHEQRHLWTSAFFTGMSERADILVLEVSNDDLSFEIFKSQIKNLSPAGLVGILADPLLSSIFITLVVCQSNKLSDTLCGTNESYLMNA